MIRIPGSDDDIDNAGPLVHALRLLDAGREYCARGEPIFWLRGKQPLVSKDDGGNGFRDATTNYDELAETLKRSPGATGIGQPIAAATFVLDIDPNKGGNESLAALEREHGPLPTTKEQATGGNGRHLVFLAPVEIRQLAGFRPGLDTRAAGRGYIAVEPSIHPVTHNRYRWIRRCAPAPAPSWLLELVRVREIERKPYTPPANAPNEQHERCICDRCKPKHDNCARKCCQPKHEKCICKPCFRRRYATAVFHGVTKAVANAGEGLRNTLLNWAWHKCAGMRDVLDKNEVHAALLAAATACGLDEREALKVLR